jgi:hypothetical protein
MQRCYLHPQLDTASGRHRAMCSVIDTELDPVVERVGAALGDDGTVPAHRCGLFWAAQRTKRWSAVGPALGPNESSRDRL